VSGWLPRWLRRARATLAARHDRELRDGLELHVQLLEDEDTAQGIAPDQPGSAPTTTSET
jgi:hypothetical protein